MIDSHSMAALLDSLKNPVVFADTHHTIIYMNEAAKKRYADRGGAKLLGQSLLDCHNEQSRQTIIDILIAMAAGETERLITDSQKHQAYMRAVRDSEGKLLGYYERYEPPAK
ncbi:MAG: PAS domain-containing protein [Chloroflexota bacterium]|nr:PAS domain-containing protein [Chloroflexota bacterium]